MQAILNGHKVAASDDIVETGGYAYFPRDSVRMEWLEKTEKTASDLQCPHGVQFYDVVDRRRAPQAQRLVVRGAATQDGTGRQPLRLLGRRPGRLTTQYHLQPS